MSEKLLPCPFCGGANLSDEEGSTRIRNYRRIACEECCADAPFTEWNLRADDALRQATKAKLMEVATAIENGVPRSAAVVVLREIAEGL